MQLRLAEYKDGKFERFLELGEDFLFGGEFVYLPKGIPQPDFWENGEQEEFYGSLFKLDQKDPLNRFDGLFDGLTYSNGRFVLIEGLGIKDRNDKEIFIHDILAQQDKYANLTQDLFLVRGNRTHITGYEGGNFYGINLDCHITSAIFDSKDIDLRTEILGSLHENPELWEKVK